MEQLDFALESLDYAIDKLDVAEEGVGTVLLLAHAVPIGLGILYLAKVEHDKEKTKKAFDKYVSQNDQKRILEMAKKLALPKIKKSQNTIFKRVYKRDITVNDLTAEFGFARVTKTTIRVFVEFDDNKIELENDDEMPTETSIYQHTVTIKYDYVAQKFLN